MRSGQGGGLGPWRAWDRMAVPAICVVVLSIGLAAGVSRIDSLRLTAASVPTHAVIAQVPTAQVPTAQMTTAQPGESSVEDVVTLPVGEQYVWPSGIGLVAAPSTIRAPSGPGGVAVVRVRTTVHNGSATPYDVDAVLGPSARFGGRDVVTIADSRFAVGAAEQVVSPGQQLAYDTTFPAGTGPLTLHYRADFRFEAVEFEDPAVTFGHS
jgi:hypothetical protein